MICGKIRVRGCQPPIVINDAFIYTNHTAQTTSNSNAWWRKYQHGIFDHNGTHISDLNDIRGGRKIFWPHNAAEAHASRKQTRLRHIEFMLYGGTLYNHFGHLLMEASRGYALTRLYRHFQQPIWFHCPNGFDQNGRPSTKFGPLLHDWLSFTGLKGKIRIIRESMMARTLVSAQQLYADRAFVSQELPQMCYDGVSSTTRERLNQARQPKGHIAYLARTHLKRGSTDYIGESSLISAIQEIKGVDIYHPEDLSLEQKTRIFASYKYVIGLPQSAMNLRLFARPVGGTGGATVILLCPGEAGLSSSWINLELAGKYGDILVNCTPLDETTTQQCKTSSGFQASMAFNTSKAERIIRELTD